MKLIWKEKDIYHGKRRIFYGNSFLSAKSKDPVTQVGACIVKDNKIIGIGYNGFPKGSSDDELPWGKSDNFLESKHAYVVHAELNTNIKF